MKKLALFPLVIAVSLAATGARAQFPDFPAADLVLGATNFTSGGTGGATASGLSLPVGVAIAPLSGKLFVSSVDHNRVLRFPNVGTLANGANAETVFGQMDFSGTAEGATATTFNAPFGLHVDGLGRLWVADYENHRVLMFENASTLPGFGSTPDLVLGQPDFTTVTPTTSISRMSFPQQVFVDAADNLWVADYGNSRVLKFADVSSLGNGALATAVLGQPNFGLSTTGTTAAKMNRPSSVTVDGAGRLWVADQLNHRVLRFDNAASLGTGASATAVLGQAIFTTSSTGTTAQTMNAPSAVVVDAAGTLYLAEVVNHRVLIFKNAAAKADGAAADGVIGQPDFTTATPGTTERKLDGPFGGMALDGAGRLWVSDYSNFRVLRFSPDRSVATPTVGRVPKTTARAKLKVKGTAADANGITQVRYRVGKGALKAAQGTTAWTFKAKLKPGKNKIEIVAVDSFGNTSPAKTVKVKRQ